MKTTLKSLFFLAILLLAAISSAQSQPVWEGDYTITSTADIVALSEYTEVTGVLTIGYPSLPAGVTSTELEDLSGLENLSSVGGNLIVTNNHLLTWTCQISDNPPAHLIYYYGPRRDEDYQILSTSTGHFLF